MQSPQMFGTTRQDLEIEELKEWAADKLLARENARGKEPGAYRETTIRRHEAREKELATRRGPDLILFQNCEILADNEPTIGELITAAMLTAQEMQAVRLAAGIIQPPGVLPGVKVHQRQIAEVLNVNQQRVSVILRQARKKMEAVAPKITEDPPSLYVMQVFLDELRLKRRLTYRRRITRFKLRSPKRMVGPA